jgi:ATP-dependent exoDNAse (exonuclease V) alpha subunit
MSSQGPKPLVMAITRGCLSPETLYLKIGATVMFTKNNPKKGFVNGTVGTIEAFDKEDGYPIVKIKSGQCIKVDPVSWEIELNGKILAQITQLPLRLAWAITVHKSQGMNLDEAIMDLSKVFEFGQGYVALSRVRRLSGLYLLGWNERTFQVHPKILAKDKIFKLVSSDTEITFSKISADELQKKYDNFIGAKKNNAGNKHWRLFGRAIQSQQLQKCVVEPRGQF